MVSWKSIEFELRQQEQALERGEAGVAMQHLNFLFAQIDVSEAENAFAGAAVLSLLARAAEQLGDLESASRAIERAVGLLKRSTHMPAYSQAHLLLGLAERLSTQGQAGEAMHFADSALEALSLAVEQFTGEEIAEILRRYAAIARDAGSIDPAQIALTFALLLIHDASGVESDVAQELLSITEGISLPMQHLRDYLLGTMSCSA